MILMTVLEHLHSALPITKAVKTVTNPKQIMFCRCVPLLGGKHIYVCLRLYLVILKFYFI